LLLRQTVHENNTEDFNYQISDDEDNNNRLELEDIPSIETVRQVAKYMIDHTREFDELLKKAEREDMSIQQNIKSAFGDLMFYHDTEDFNANAIRFKLREKKNYIVAEFLEEHFRKFRDPDMQKKHGIVFPTMNILFDLFVKSRGLVNHLPTTDKLTVVLEECGIICLKKKASKDNGSFYAMGIQPINLFQLTQDYRFVNAPVVEWNGEVITEYHPVTVRNKKGEIIRTDKINSKNNPSKLQFLKPTRQSIGNVVNLNFWTKEELIKYRRQSNRRCNVYDDDEIEQFFIKVNEVEYEESSDDEEELTRKTKRNIKKIRDK
jgi:hypothetical protein